MGNASVTGIIELLLSLIVTGFFLAAMIPPTEDSVTNIQGALNGSITGEQLGTADTSGNLSASLDHPLDNTTYTVFNESGTPHTAWTNSGVIVLNEATGIVIFANGSNNSTASNAITIQYTRTDTQAPEAAGLPRVAYLLAILLAFVGIIYMVTGGKI